MVNESSNQTLVDLDRSTSTGMILRTKKVPKVKDLTSKVSKVKDKDKEKDKVKAKGKNKQLPSNNVVSIQDDIVDSIDSIDDPKMWVSATQLKNYATCNTLEDYLDLYGPNNVITNNNSSDNDNNDVKVTTNTMSTVTSSLAEQSLQSLFKRGYDYEDQVINILSIMFPNNVTILPSGGSGSNGVKPEFEDIKRESVKTSSAINVGVECIFQAPLVNPDNKTYGIADVIIRSDCLCRLLESTGIYPNFKDGGKNGGKNGSKNDNNSEKIIHYYIIDIKYSKLELCCDGQRIRNSDLNPAYKCQLFVYNMALAKLHKDGFTPDKAYVLGKSWSFTSKGVVHSGRNCFERLGTVEFEGWDCDVKTTVDEGLSWLRKLRTQGHSWKLYPTPSNSYLLPNMKINKVTKWQEFKSVYAKHVKDITLLWYCGVAKRDAALQQGIMCYDDPKLTIDILGFKDESGVGKQLQLILDINRQQTFSNKHDKIVIHRPDQPCSGTATNINIYPPNKLYFSIDFETMLLSTVVVTDNKSYNNNNKIESFDVDYLFMVGIVSSITGYKCFILNELTVGSQKKLLDDVLNYLRAETDIYLGEDADIPELYHWSNFEPSFLERLCGQIGYPFPSHLVWSDLLAIFHDRHIVIKDCFSYSLKDVATALHKHNLIQHCWNPNNPCKSGNVAMWLADIYYTHNFPPTPQSTVLSSPSRSLSSSPSRSSSSSPSRSSSSSSSSSSSCDDNNNDDMTVDCHVEVTLDTSANVPRSSHSSDSKDVDVNVDVDMTSTSSSSECLMSSSSSSDCVVHELKSCSNSSVMGRDEIMEYIRDYNWIDCQVVIDILLLLQSKLASTDKQVVSELSTRQQSIDNQPINEP